MKASIFSLDGKVKGEIELPKVFRTHYRPDLIQRAVLAMQSHRRQVYAADVLAGKRSAAHYHGVKDTYATMKNREMARMARLHGETMPGLVMTARIVPQATKGRAALPPVVERKFWQKINNKERRLAIKSAIAATTMSDLVNKRHRISDVNLPIVVSDEIQEIKKTKDLEKIIETLNIGSDLERTRKRKIRPGKGKMRGRKYKNKKSVLFVVADDKGILKVAENIPGVDACVVNNLNAELLAPGTQPGRLTVYSESAIKKLGEVYG